MSKTSTHIALLLLLLFSQVADAFACQSMNCMETSDASSMMKNTLEMDEHHQHDMSADADDINASDMGMCECCKQQCKCPPSIPSIAVLPNNSALPVFNPVSFTLPEYSTRMVSAVLSMEHRPPKPSIF